MALYFTSDLHLGHQNILPSRPQFKDIEEHDEYLIAQWNKKVHKNDEIYILGDLSFRSSYPISYYVNRMKGKKHLIIGNHDPYWMRYEEDLSKYFASVDKLTEIKVQKKLITMCHFPMLEWAASRYIESAASYLIHGHIHGRKGDEVYEYIQKYLPHALNAGVDVNNFEPVTFEELKANCDAWYERNR